MQTPPIGTVVQDRYVLDAIIGEGGFGVVYRARALDTQTVVAIKIAREQPAQGSDLLRRQQREVTALTQLQHPTTIRLLDHGSLADGRLFLVFEYLGGEDLSTLLADGAAWAPQRVREVLIQVLTALEEAHRVGLLHRDIKPDNIRILNPGEDPPVVKLLDFGVAREMTADRDKITVTGALVGTPRYMSPEQLTDKPLAAASDLYSLGVVAFEMLMGADAMHGWKLHDQLERLAKTSALAMPGGPGAELRVIVDKMLRRDPTQRYQTATEVLRALLPPTDEPKPSESSATPARSPVPFVLGAAALFVVAALLGVLSVFSSPESEPAPAPRRASHANGLLIPPPVLDTGVTPASDVRDAGDAQHDPSVDLATSDLGRPPSGCGTPLKKKESKLRLRLSGRDDVSLYLPRTYSPDRKYPVVMLFHDTAQTSGKQVKESHFFETANSGEFIIAAPDSHDLPFPWRPGSERSVRKALNLVDEAVCIDRERVYAVGLGFGARFVARLPCLMPEIAGIATVAYRSGPELDCKPDPPIPVLHVAGKKHLYLPIDGGQSEECLGEVEISLAAQDDLWIEHNQCRGDRRVYEKSSHGTCWTWDCDAPYASCLLEGGRGWKSTEGRQLLDVLACDGPPPKFDTADTIWRFFDEHWRAAKK